MTNEEILKKAKKRVLERTTARPAYFQSIGFMEDIQASIIFSHEFAKAFWGEDPYETDLLEYNDTPDDDRYGKDYDGRHYFTLPTWQYHLQQMVLEPEPLQYLAKFLEEGAAT